MLNSALGLPANSINLTIDGKAIKVGLAFHAGGTQQMPINFDLASLASGVAGLSQVTNLLDVSGAGSLTVGADADFNLNIGVDVTNPPVRGHSFMMIQVSILTPRPQGRI